MKTGKSVSNEVIDTWDMPRRKGKAIAGSRQERGAQEWHERRSPRSPEVKHVDHSLIVRMEQNLLLAPLQTAYTSCHYHRKTFLLGNGLGKVGSHPLAKKPETLEIGPKAKWAGSNRGDLYVHCRGKTRKQLEGNPLPLIQEVNPPLKIKMKFPI